jgi:hypothetical protein
MPLLNYTTRISYHKTVGEIQQILAKAGVVSIMIDYSNDGLPFGLVFAIRVRDIWVNFRLPCNWEGVYKAMQNDKKIPKSFKNPEQARRVAWRIVKDWVEAQMAIIEAGQAQLAEVFLPYAVTGTGKTLYQEFESGNQLLLQESS